MTGFAGPGLLAVAWILLCAFTTMAILSVLALLAIRTERRLTARRKRRKTADVRALIVSVLVDESDQADAAVRSLLALRGSAWARAQEAVLTMLPKVRGDARHRLLELLRSRRTERRAMGQTRSRRALKRGKGAFALGMLESRDAVDRLLALLDDRSPLVRRVAVRSLGQIGDIRAVEPLVAMANREVGLMRDLGFALSKFGLDGAPLLHGVIERALAFPTDQDRSAPLAATVLGIVQDVRATTILASALANGQAPLSLAAAQALGRLDSPVSVTPLAAALRDRSDQVRVAAATSLGRLGAEAAVPALLEAIAQNDLTISRAAADALVELGAAGTAALEGSPSAYAIEALALNRLRTPQ